MADLTARGPKVLIVEDELLVAMDIQQMLTHLGYVVFAPTASAEEAIASASATCPDVVLMDIRIKGERDGIETASVLGQRFDVPVVYLTAHADANTVERAKQTAPYAYLTRPFTEGALTSAIEIAAFKHRTDRKLRERERWFSTTLRSIGDAVVTVDLSGKVSYLNPEAERLLGISCAEAIGQLARTLVRLDAPSQPESPLDHALQSQQHVVVREARLRSQSGSWLTISDGASPVIDDGEMLGAVMVFRDVTEEKRLEKRVELADRLASLGMMTAGIAHEVNNPLMVVISNSTLLLDDLRDLSKRLGEDLVAERARLAAMLEAQSDVVDASKRIAHVIEDMRVLSQPARLPTDSCDLSVAVAWAVRATAHEFLHRAMVKVENVAQGTWVKLDAGRIEQILINLLVNAAHAISPGHAQGNRVVLFMRREPGKVVLEISDTGAGMSPEVVARVFEPFFTTKELGHGTGLGLAICRGIVTAAGGDLEVESQLGKGSSFRLSLPEAAPQETPSEPSRAAAAQAGPCARILVIDDEPSILRLLPRLLPRHDVVCLAEARAALQLLEYDSNFDVILCDLMMPNMSGMQLYEALLARAPRLARRMVFMTGGVTTASTADFLRVVGNDCLTKPILRDELQSFIDRRLVEPPRA